LARAFETEQTATAHDWILRGVEKGRPAARLAKAVSSTGVPRRHCPARASRGISAVMVSGDPFETNNQLMIELLHEVAEGLQAVSVYLAAARAGKPSGSNPDLIEKAEDQLERVRRAYARLRRSLIADPGDVADDR
jgi:hypothetical protein